MLGATPPKTRYTKSGAAHLAYLVLGEGPMDLVFVAGWVSHIDLYWEWPESAHFVRRLASFSRLILFDKRGTGLSDRVPSEELPTLEQRMDDVRAVMDAAGSERAALLGLSEGGPMEIPCRLLRERKTDHHPLNVGGDLHPSGSTTGARMFAAYTTGSFVEESGADYGRKPTGAVTNDSVEGPISRMQHRRP